MKKPYLAMTGKGKGKGNGFEINQDLINDKRIGVITLDDVGRGALRPQEPPRQEPRVIYNGPGPGKCSVCFQPVNIPTGTCGTCPHCTVQFGGC